MSGFKLIHASKSQFELIYVRKGDAWRTGIYYHKHTNVIISPAHIICRETPIFLKDHMIQRPCYLWIVSHTCWAFIG